MTGYLLRRVVQAFLILVIVSILTFLETRLLPGDPARAIMGIHATPAQLEAFREEHGYNDSILMQYVQYVSNLLHGDLGFSVAQNQSVTALIEQNLPPTVLLVGLSVVVAVLLATPLGMLQAVRRNHLVDYVLTTASFIFYSMPSFWLGLLLISFFAIQLEWLPPGAPQGSVWDVLASPQGLVLPVMTLALVILAEFSRYMRSSTLDNLGQDYVVTARAKGASERRVLYRHVLRNSLLPIVTLLGLRVPAILNGALITESVFNFPGIGRLFWNSAQNHDYAVLLGVTLIVAVGAVVGSLLADATYAILDPRIQYVKAA